MNDLPLSTSVPEVLIGCPAPKLYVEEYLQGDPVWEFARGQVYVVDLWATWCGPCVGDLPHLSALQRMFPQITVLGIAVWEQHPEAVRSFLAQHTGQITYRVGVESPLPGNSDRGYGLMSRYWLDASYRATIPALFIVDGEGRIALSGGYAQQIEKPLRNILDGSWDIDARAAAESASMAKHKTKERFRYGQALRNANGSVDRLAVLDEVIARHPELELQAEFGAAKLDILLQAASGTAAAVEYARHLLDAAGDSSLEAVAKVLISQRLVRIGMLLSHYKDDLPESVVAVDPVLGALAVRAMQLAESLLLQTRQGKSLHFELIVVHALMVAGRTQDALDRAKGALLMGEAQSALPQWQGATAASLQRILVMFRHQVTMCREMLGMSA